MATVNSSTTGTSEDTKTIVTVLLLVSIYPVGLIVMWFWTHWKTWVKIVVTIASLIIPLLIVLFFLIPMVLITINPARQFSQANNTQRRADVVMILQSLLRYKADNANSLPQGLTNDGMVKNIAATDVGSDFCKALIPTYLAALPKDPQAGTFESCDGYDTKYTISVSPEGQITVSAPDAELDAQISVTK